MSLVFGLPCTIWRRSLARYSVWDCR